jgi:aminoglycoside phosphotransferase family enzyme/predicted kinase
MDQQAVVDFLVSFLAAGGSVVERIDTHAAIVFLAGDRAWKLKRAVRYDYLDFSTSERRREMCEAEVRLNRRTAPQLYLGVRPVTREPDGTLALGGCGQPIDWLIEMERFDQGALCDRRAAEGTLEVDAMADLATAIARFHAAAARRPDHGGRDAMAWVVDGNVEGFSRFGSFLDQEACARLTARSHEIIDAHHALLDRRRRDGFVRQCHGDLHLRNIVMLDGRPTLFDAVEFNDEIACIDVWYDVAFLLMDLARRQLPRHANVVFNRYLSETGDDQALPLLPLFLSCRAAIRAKTSATAAAMDVGEARRVELQTLSRQYLAMAEQLLRPAAPRLVAIGGLSGSGKSTLAMSLAPAVGGSPGAVVLRSDEVRKALCGVPRLQRLGAEAYRAEMSARVYDTLNQRAARVLGAGHSVIVDAVHARPADREAVERVAAAVGVPFAGLWLEAPPEVLVERTTARRHDPSDADPDVVRLQLRQPVGAMRWRTLDASRPGDEVLALASHWVIE